LLFELNRIWYRRETNAVKRIKSRLGGTLSGLKREVNKAKSFDEVQAKKTISRLKV
jgi:hypothetical protein